MLFFYFSNGHSSVRFFYLLYNIHNIGYSQGEAEDREQFKKESTELDYLLDLVLEFFSEIDVLLTKLILDAIDLYNYGCDGKSDENRQVNDNCWPFVVPHLEYVFPATVEHKHHRPNIDMAIYIEIVSCHLIFL